MSTVVKRFKFSFSRKMIVVLISIVAVLMVSSLCGAWILSEEKEITLSVNQNEMIVTTYTNTLAELLAEQGIEEENVVSCTPSLYAVLHNGDYVSAVVSAEYKIMADGDVITVQSTGKTVADVLAEAGVALGACDEVAPQLDDIAFGNLTINVDRITVREETKETVLAYSTEKHNNNTIAQGTEIVTRVGQPGLQTDTYRVTYRDGELYKEELVNSVITDPVSEIIEVGTAADNYILNYQAMQQSATANNSENESAASNCIDFSGNTCSRVITLKATAYHEGSGSRTKSGTLSRVGAVAVDPDVIPLGTLLYVEGYGYCIAEDTGGLIKGDRIDVYLDSEAECEAWGVKDVTVYVFD